MKRIDADLLETDDNQVYYFEGNPFTGVAYENRPDGSVWNEQTFSTGVPDGPSRSWYEGGKLESEMNYKLGWTNGLHREWYPNGQLKLEEKIELGIVIELKEWDRAGVLSNSFRIKEDSGDFQELQRLRANENMRVQRIRDLVTGPNAK